MQENIDHPERFQYNERQARHLLNARLPQNRSLLRSMEMQLVWARHWLYSATSALLLIGARIGDPHVRAGFVAGDGGAVIWPQLIGYGPREGVFTDRNPNSGGGRC